MTAKALLHVAAMSDTDRFALDRWGRATILVATTIDIDGDRVQDKMLDTLEKCFGPKLKLND